MGKAVFKEGGCTCIQLYYTSLVKTRRTVTQSCTPSMTYANIESVDFIPKIIVMIY